MNSDLAFCKAMVAWFNENFPVGTRVQVLRNNDELVTTRVRIRAQCFADRNGWDAIAWFEDIAGHYTILDLPDGRDRIREVED